VRGFAYITKKWGRPEMLTKQVQDGQSRRGDGWWLLRMKFGSDVRQSLQGVAGLALVA
jgi:hypothetical protein